MCQPRVIAHGIKRLRTFRFQNVIGMIIEQDHIDIGACRQLIGAELTHAHQRHLPACKPSMGGLHLLDHRVQRSLDDKAREVGEGMAGDRPGN